MISVCSCEWVFIFLMCDCSVFGKVVCDITKAKSVGSCPQTPLWCMCLSIRDAMIEETEPEKKSKERGKQISLSCNIYVSTPAYL